MVRSKSIRTKGKISFSRYFQRFSKGDSVAVVREMSLAANFPKNIQGNTGLVVGKRGKSYIIKIQNKEHIIEPAHLKKIKQLK